MGRQHVTSVQSMYMHISKSVCRCTLWYEVYRYIYVHICMHVYIFYCRSYIVSNRKMKLSVAAVLLVCLSPSLALPGGAPSTACVNLRPQHSTNNPQTNPSNYRINIEAFEVNSSSSGTEFVYIPGSTYTSKRRYCMFSDNVQLMACLFSYTQ